MTAPMARAWFEHRAEPPDVADDRSFAPTNDDARAIEAFDPQTLTITDENGVITRHNTSIVPRQSVNRV